MTLSNRIMISEVLSKDLALRNNADTLFEELNKIKTKEIVIDFRNVKSITRSFAHQYKENKCNSKKIVLEENVPLNISKMFKVVSRTIEREPLINLKTAQVITI